MACVRHPWVVNVTHRHLKGVPHIHVLRGMAHQEGRAHDVAQGKGEHLYRVTAMVRVSVMVMVGARLIGLGLG